MNENYILKKNAQWLQSYWRPSVGVTYIVINLFDFIIFPILWTVTSYITKGEITQWKPLTLEYTGLFHLAFGAILGVSAWSRNKEKFQIDNGEISYDRYTHSNRDRYSESSSYRRYQERDPYEDEPSSVYRGERNNE